MTYAEWTEAFVAKHNGHVRGKCREAAHAMVKAFPELRTAAGFAHWVQRDQHWWCVAPDGSIVDPTVDQFAGLVPEYEELDLDDPATRAKVPTGRCMECGDDAYEHRSFCSDQCEASFAAYLAVR